ncbi:VOC family protein [Burkholderia sp. F1]|uniref:VOC family protein n=1 Tax=Burkholderia sp. F1 TaxID=3366817 RepID=UPI003D7383EF
MQDAPYLLREKREHCRRGASKKAVAANCDGVRFRQFIDGIPRMFRTEGVAPVAATFVDVPGGRTLRVSRTTRALARHSIRGTARDRWRRKRCSAIVLPRRSTWRAFASIVETPSGGNRRRGFESIVATAESRPLDAGAGRQSREDMEDAKGRIRLVIPVKPKSMQRMTEFYGSGLGFEVTEDGEVLFGGPYGGVGTFLYENGKGPLNRNAIIQIEIAKDFGAFCRRLKDAGAKFEEIGRLPVGYFAHFRDPSDNLITIYSDEDDEESDKIVYGWAETVTID